MINIVTLTSTLTLALLFLVFLLSLAIYKPLFRQARSNPDLG